VLAPMRDATRGTGERAVARRIAPGRICNARPRGAPRSLAQICRASGSTLRGAGGGVEVTMAAFSTVFFMTRRDEDVELDGWQPHSIT